MRAVEGVRVEREVGFFFLPGRLMSENSNAAQYVVRRRQLRLFALTHYYATSSWKTQPLKTSNVQKNDNMQENSQASTDTITNAQSCKVQVIIGTKPDPRVTAMSARSGTRPEEPDPMA